MTEEEENLLLQEPSIHKAASVEGSEGTVDLRLEKLFLEDDDTRSIASSAKFSISSTASIRKKVINCKMTIKRLQKRQHLGDNDKRRLQNALDFLGNQSLESDEPCANSPPKAGFSETSSKGALMQPPMPVICLSLSGQGSVASDPAKEVTDKEDKNVSPGEANSTLDSAVTVVDKPSKPKDTESLDLTEASAVTAANLVENNKPSSTVGKQTDPLKMRRNARRLINRLKRRDPNSFTERETAQLARARETMTSTEGAWRSSQKDKKQNPTGIGKMTGPREECLLPSALSRSKPEKPGVNSVKDSSKAEETPGCSRKVLPISSRLELKPRASVSGGAGRELVVAGAKCRLPFTSTVTDPRPLGAVSDKDTSKSGIAPGVSKRGRHDDTISPVVGRQAKKLKFAEKVKESLRVAIIDLGNPNRRLTANQWELIEQRILDGVNDAIVKAENKLPLFGQLTTFKGFKMMECDDEETLVWLKKFVSNTKAPWSKADLRVVDRKEILSITRPKGRILIRGPYLPAERIERNLQFLNPELQSREWKVLETSEYTENGMEVTVLLSHKSLPLLRKHDFKVRVGITRCKLRLIAEKQKSRGETEAARDEDNTNKSSSQ